MPSTVIYALSIFTLVRSQCPYFKTNGRLSEATVELSRSSFNTMVYAEALAKLDWNAVVADIKALLTDSKSFWPADFGNYGPLMIRQAWHCTGSYRSFDGFGGCDGARQRFDPERSWADNTNLDKTKTLLLPIKEKYGLGLSWGDLIILSGNVAIESMGGPVLGFCGGRIDDDNGMDSQLLGPTVLQEEEIPCPVNGQCELPFGATTIGLIYVNPEGPMGVPLPAESATQIRDVFGRMTFNDTETIALIGGGHAFGKVHGACPLGAGPSPKESPTNPWPGLCGSGKGNDTFTSGFEGQWTNQPTKWSNDYFTNLLSTDWHVTVGPGAHYQWASDDSNYPFTMLTSDIAVRNDSTYYEIAKKYMTDISSLEYDFMHAWYKLASRDMGPASRCAGPFVPIPQDFQYPLPAPPAQTSNFVDVKLALKSLMTTNNTLLTPDVIDGQPTYAAVYVHLAWQCASTFRATDYKGGCDGGRIRFSPQISWPVNVRLAQALEMLQPIKNQFGNGLSWADLIILSGNVGLELSGSSDLTFCGGRTDAPSDDGGWSAIQPNGNYSAYPFTNGSYIPTAKFVRYSMKVLGLTVEEAVALSARPRSQQQLLASGYNQQTWTSDGSSQLSNEYFQVLLSNNWEEIVVPSSGYVQWKAVGAELYMLPVDLVVKFEPDFAAVAQSYVSDNSAFVFSFKSAWTKVMNADRFDGPVYNLCYPHISSTGSGPETDAGINKYASDATSSSDYSYSNLELINDVLVATTCVMTLLAGLFAYLYYSTTKNAYALLR